MPDTIPQPHLAAVSRAIREAFGVNECEAIHEITRGLTAARLYRIVIQGRPYLLRIGTWAGSAGDLARPYLCMQAAAEAGLAPPVHFISMEDRLSITGFVEPAPFPLPEARAAMPRLLRTLHALPPFPKELNHVTVDRTLQKFRSANILPEPEVERIFARYRRVSAVYPRVESDMVSCHCDLKPENIVFDGQRPWLLDWEAAFVNDRYFDLAVIANFIVATDAQEESFLHEYFGQPPDACQRARFFLMRQVVHMMYAAFFLLLGSAGKAVNPSQAVPDFRDFHERLWAGTVNLTEGDMKTVYGRVHWAQLRHDTAGTRFDEAIRIVAETGAASRLLPETA